MHSFRPTLLLVNLDSRLENLADMELCIIEVNTTAKAVKAIKDENPALVASSWQMPDGRDGEFLARLRQARPNMPIIALVPYNDCEEEIQARSLGIPVVLPDDIDNESFRAAVCQLLCIDNKDQSLRIRASINNNLSHIL